MTKKEKKILGYIKYISNVDYINDAQEMQDALMKIHDLFDEKLPEVEEFAYPEDFEKDNDE